MMAADDEVEILPDKPLSKRKGIVPTTLDSYAVPRELAFDYSILFVRRSSAKRIKLDTSAASAASESQTDGGAGSDWGSANPVNARKVPPNNRGGALERERCMLL